MQTKETFGEYMRKLREERKLPLRKIAAALDIDPSTLSKIERNERFPTREMLKLVASTFTIDEKELIIRFLSDKIAYELFSEDTSTEVLKAAEEKIKYLRQKKSKQGKIDF